MTGYSPPMQKTLFVELPDHFNFRSTIYSHGWCELRPFAIDEEKWTLSYVFAGTNGAGPVPVVISEENGRLKIEIESLTVPERLVSDVRHLLRLDDDLEGLYRS